MLRNSRLHSSCFVVAIVSSVGLFAILMFAWLVLLDEPSHAPIRSLDEFSAVWKATPVPDRHTVVAWLLGQEPTRHTTYPLSTTKLRGLRKEDVIALLGQSTIHEDNDYHPGQVYYRIYYPLGSIEYDVLWLKQDDLLIIFDNDGQVVEVRTTS